MNTTNIQNQIENSEQREEFLFEELAISEFLQSFY